MLRLVPQTALISSPDFVHSSQRWQASVYSLIRDFSVSETEQIYPFTGESIFDAYWRTLCFNRSSIDNSTPPASATSYLAWKRLLEMQVIRHAAEESYRRSNKLHKTWFSIAATLSVSALTYRFRRSKFLLVAIPFCLPPMIQYFNRTWNQGLGILLTSLHNLYMQSSAQIQIEQRDFEGSHSQWCQGRQFFVTEKGFVGWCPVAARVGDVLGLFAGCRIPYVLRRGSGGKEMRWKIVGDAYVHGIMDGEVEKYEVGGEGMIRIE
jgi:hypothetical protein